MIKMIKLADGRRVQVTEAGLAGGKPIVAHHGTPSEAGTWKMWDKTASELGIRLISITRPGYAESDALPRRKVSDVVTDVEQVLKYLGIKFFQTVGWSGGGPHALACAAILKDRCRAVATVGGVAPYGMEDLDFLEGMGIENINEMNAALRGEVALKEWMKTEGPACQTMASDSLFQSFGSLLPPVDKKFLTDALTDGLAETIRLSLKKGFQGWIDDDLAFVNPWGFNLENITIPTMIWQGHLDKMVPLSHGQWLSKHIKNSTPCIYPDEGHVSILIGRQRDILEGLLKAK